MIKKTPINYKVAIYFSIIILVAALIWISLRFSVNYEETYNKPVEYIDNDNSDAIDAQIKAGEEMNSDS